MLSQIEHKVETQTEVDPQFFADAMSSLRTLHYLLEQEDFSSYYEKLRPVRSFLAYLRDQLQGYQRYALCYIHDAFAYTPTYSVTPSHILVLQSSLELARVVSGPAGLDEIYSKLVEAGFDILPRGKHPLDKITKETCKEDDQKCLTEIEKRLSSVTSTPIPSLTTELVPMIKDGRVDEYDYCGLIADWLYYRSVMADWVNAEEELAKVNATSP